jgi:hypothetical protein
MSRRAALLLLLAGCGAGAEGAPDLAPAVGIDQTVPLFSSVLFDAKHQRNRAAAALPAPALYRRVTLHLELACPAGRCDRWDRTGRLYLVEGDPERRIEVARFITPFGVGGAWDVDVTDLSPLLSGARGFEALIETWVEAGSPYGNGWLLDARLVYEGGLPADEPVAVAPLGWGDVGIGDPAKPPALAEETLTPPPGAGRAALRLLVTGHGQGNALNCAEFCALEHAVLVDGARHAVTELWREGCADNPIDKQTGTWQHDRAGWCPGADVIPWRVDLGPRAAPFRLGYHISDYDNGCRPDGCNPAACRLGTSCDFDGGNHTPPVYALSALLVWLK